MRMARWLSFAFGMAVGWLAYISFGQAADVRVGKCFKLRDGVAGTFESTIVIKLTGVKVVDDIYKKKASMYVYNLHSYSDPTNKYPRLIEFFNVKAKKDGLFIPMSPFPPVLMETPCG